MAAEEGESRPQTRFYSQRTLIWILALLAVCIVLPLLLQVRQITDLDTWLFLEAREQYETGLKTFLRVFTELGSLFLWFPIVLLLWLARRKREAAALFVALFMVVVIAASIKYAIDRPRPFDVIQAIDPLYRPTDPSFPSAHAMTIFAAAVTIGTMWNKALLPLLFLAAAVGFSRVYIGVHFPYDVASGALIGILIGLVVHSLDLTGLVGWTDRLIGRITRRKDVSSELQFPSSDSQDEIRDD